MQNKSDIFLFLSFSCDTTLTTGTQSSGLRVIGSTCPLSNCIYLHSTGVQCMANLGTAISALGRFNGDFKIHAAKKKNHIQRSRILSKKFAMHFLLCMQRKMPCAHSKLGQPFYHEILYVCIKTPMVRLDQLSC